MDRRTLLLSVPVIALAAACTSEESGGDGGDTPADATALLTKASETFAAAKSVAFTLSSDGVPDDVNGVSAADGSGVIDATEPKFQGKLTGRVQGITGSLEVIAIGDQVWMKFFTPDYEPIDVTTLGAPNPAMIFHPTTGLPSLITATTGAAVGEQKRQGSDILTQVTGKIPAAPVQSLLKLGDGQGEYDVTYGITDSGELRTVALSGELYAGSESTYSMVVTDYGTSVEISPP